MCAETLNSNRLHCRIWIIGTGHTELQVLSSHQQWTYVVQIQACQGAKLIRDSLEDLAVDFPGLCQLLRVLVLLESLTELIGVGQVRVVGLKKGLNGSQLMKTVCQNCLVWITSDLMVRATSGAVSIWFRFILMVLDLCYFLLDPNCHDH